MMMNAIKTLSSTRLLSSSLSSLSSLTTPIIKRTQILKSTFNITPTSFATFTTNVNSTSISLQDKQAQRDFYDKNGYLVIENLVKSDDLNQLKHEIVRVCRQMTQQQPQSFPDVAQPHLLSDSELLQRCLCIHHPHKMSKWLKQILFYPSIIEVLTNIISPNIKCMQSMFFVKASGQPGQAWHQDEWYIPTRDRSLCGVWIAIDDATIENGCLWMHPGSHQPGVLWPQHQHHDSRFDPAGESYQFPYDKEGGVAIPVKAGGVAFFNGYVLHRSLPNHSTGYRRAYCSHYMSAESYLPWDCDGTISKRDDNRDIILVAGTDPYEYKGTEQLTHPFVRLDQGSIDGSLEGKGAAAVRRK